MSWVDSNGNVYITSGNVSIGAQVYDEALNVQGNIRAKSTGHADLIADAAAGNNAGLILRRDGTVRWAMQSVDGDVLYLTRFGDFGYARALTIDNASGNVGVDNASPAAKLDVNGDIKASGVVVVGDGGASAPSLTFVSDPDTGIYRGGANELRIATGGAARLTVDANGKVSIAAPSSGVALEVAGMSRVSSDANHYADMSIDASGNLKIDPHVYQGAGGTVQVEGNVRARSSAGSAEVAVDAAGNANASLVLSHEGTVRWAIQSVQGSPLLISRFNGSGQLTGRVFKISNDNGYVGIGLGANDTPAEMLEVAGNLKVSGNILGGSGGLAVSGGQKYYLNGAASLQYITYDPNSGTIRLKGATLDVGGGFQQEPTEELGLSIDQDGNLQTNGNVNILRDGVHGSPTLLYLGKQGYQSTVPARTSYLFWQNRWNREGYFWSGWNTFRHPATIKRTVPPDPAVPSVAAGYGYFPFSRVLK